MACCRDFVTGKILRLAPSRELRDRVEETEASLPHIPTCHAGALMPLSEMGEQYSPETVYVT